MPRYVLPESGPSPAEGLLKVFADNGRTHFTGVPCSLLKGVFDTGQVLKTLSIRHGLAMTGGQLTSRARSSGSATLGRSMRSTYARSSGPSSRACSNSATRSTPTPVSARSSVPSTTSCRSPGARAQRETCPHRKPVGELLTKLQVSYMNVNVPKPREERHELIPVTGSKLIPALVDGPTVIPGKLEDNSDLITYLTERYGAPEALGAAGAGAGVRVAITTGTPQLVGAGRDLGVATVLVHDIAAPRPEIEAEAILAAPLRPHPGTGLSGRKGAMPTPSERRQLPPRLPVPPDGRRHRPGLGGVVSSPWAGDGHRAGGTGKPPRRAPREALRRPRPRLLMDGTAW